MSKNSPKQLISREAIRAGYRQGEEAVIALVEGLLENLEQLETRVMELEGRLSKNSRNSSQPPSDDGFGKQTKSLRTQSERKAGGQPEHSGQTLEWSSDVEQRCGAASGTVRRLRRVASAGASQGGVCAAGA